MRLRTRNRARRRGLPLGAVLLAVLAAAGLLAYAFLQRNTPERHAGIEAHFKYGSIGAESEIAGVPYWIWVVLPRVFPEHLPDRPGEGYARMGFVYESANQTRPIGTSLRERPIALVGLNCAVCHTGVVRDSPQAPPRIILGMPAHQFDIETYFRFLFACARDERFNADTLVAAIRQENPSFSWFEELIYRHMAIPRTRDGLRRRADEVSALADRPPFGPGRVDTFNPYKIHFGFDMRADDTIGTADLPSLWNQRPRQGMWLHWDGNNNRVEERNISAALGAGATEDSLDHDSLQRVADWIWDFGAPRLPLDRIDASRVESGRSVYQAECASCHAFDGHEVGQVVSLNQIGTDPERLRSFTPELAERMNTFGTGRPWDFSHFRKTDGYASMPLDGLWLRAPYLHNGSVPTLRDLLEPPERRPSVFVRGYGVYDYANVGFVSAGPEAEREGFRFDTGVRGNGNGGHLYGTDLSQSDKEALLEFLKTL
jgi:mono/diheme cytochrome c family protein